MPIFEKPPRETLAPAKDRWTPVYFEHGRLEVDDSSVKLIGADRTVLRVPVATLSTILLGPGTTVTHAAIKAYGVPRDLLSPERIMWWLSWSLRMEPMASTAAVSVRALMGCKFYFPI